VWIQLPSNLIFPPWNDIAVARAISLAASLLQARSQQALRHCCQERDNSCDFLVASTISTCLEFNFLPSPRIPSPPPIPPLIYPPPILTLPIPPPRIPPFPFVCCVVVLSSLFYCCRFVVVLLLLYHCCIVTVVVFVAVFYVSSSSSLPMLYCCIYSSLLWLS